MTNFFELVIDFIRRLFVLLNEKIVFTAFGTSVSLLHIIGSFIILSMVISIFWKGAKA